MDELIDGSLSAVPSRRHGVRWVWTAEVDAIANEWVRAAAARAVNKGERAATA